jgi:transcriptional regulator with XRE-family HTH domain
VTKDIAERIRSIRLQKGIKAITVAKDVGISKGFFSLLENGKRNLSALHVRNIAEALDVPAGMLYGEVPMPPSGEVQEPERKHLRPINKNALGRRLRPVLGERTGDAVDLLAVWLEDPKEAAKLATEQAAKKQKDQAKAGPSRTGQAA